MNRSARPHPARRNSIRSRPIIHLHAHKAIVIAVSGAVAEWSKARPC